VRAVAVAARTADYIAAAEAVALAVVVLAGAAVGAAAGVGTMLYSQRSWRLPADR